MSDNYPDFTVTTLGECRYPSPFHGVRFTSDNERVLYHARLEDLKACTANSTDPPAMECAGPRERLFFDPAQLACGIGPAVGFVLD